MRPREDLSHVRVAAANSGCDSQSQLVTDGRTDEPQTKVQTAINEQSATCGRVQGNDESWVSLADVLAAGVAGTRQRFPVTRTGPREPVPYHVRAAVWLRDRGVCQKCYVRNPKPWELDHIVPWSAGGPDSSTNLRVLCEPCNQERSNYDDGTVFAKGPVTWWCQRCYVDPVRFDYDWPTGVYCPTHRHDINGRSSCSVERVYAWQADEKPSWHRRPPIETFTERAFCAHCLAPGLTDVTL